MDGRDSQSQQQEPRHCAGGAPGGLDEVQTRAPSIAGALERPISEFPKRPATTGPVERTVKVVHEIPFNPRKDEGNDEKSISVPLQAAWMLLVSLYLNAEDGVIATATTCRNRGILWPELSLIPFSIGKDSTTSELCQTAQNASSHLLWTSDQRSPPSILLLASRVENEHQTSMLEIQKVYWPDCPLLLVCVYSSGTISVEAFFDPKIVSRSMAGRLPHQLCHIGPQFVAGDSPVDRLNLVDDIDHAEILKCNRGGLECDTTVDHLIASKVRSQPAAQAVSAHDGTMSYMELHARAERLASHMIAMGVQPGHYVPILFEKSAWIPVAMLGVMIAGAAFVPLSPQYPAHLIESVCKRVRARVALASRSLSQASGLAAVDVVTLTHDLFENVPDYMQSPPASSTPESVAYVLFTSGSTGQPKGAMIAHRSIVASARNFVIKTQMQSDTRMMQFSNCIFGAAMLEIWATLIVGGCLCIPSEEERMSRLGPFMEEHRVNYAFMTPSLALLQSPDTLPGLRALVTGGEVVTSDLLQRWAPYVNLYIVYGSAEQAHVIAIHGPARATQNGANFGCMNQGSHAWIVRPDCVDQLLPLGCLGELVTEGPQIARGYVQSAEQTVEAFPRSLPWRDQFPPHQDGRSRFYRTGDLVRYANGGSYEFVARREGYVKLHGQRIELGEIEYQARCIIPKNCSVCVELVAPKQEREGNSVLILFAGLGDTYVVHDSGSPSLLPTEHTRRRTATLFQELRTHLSREIPPYMVPQYYFPLSFLPMTISGKIARKELQILGGKLTRPDLLSLVPSQTGQTTPCSAAEVYLQQVWASILGLPKSHIHADDTFFEIGGNSVKAVQLLQHLRRDGYVVSMREILSGPRLFEMAIKCAAAQD